MAPQPHWNNGVSLPSFPRVERDYQVDVVVIGGGITGITTAYLLKQAGFSVMLLERDRCGQVDTGHTSAHLTYVTDRRLHRLVDEFGKKQAAATWDAGFVAIDQIESIIRRENINCEFARVPGFLHLPLTNGNGSPSDIEREIALLQRDAEIATELGLSTSYEPNIPSINRPGVQFANQARFHPLKYLAHLASVIPGNNSYVMERSEVAKVVDDPIAVEVNGHSIRCNHIVVATHVPLMGLSGFINATLLQSKIHSYNSYVVGGVVPKGRVPDALYWDTMDPYHYLRIQPHVTEDYVIFGGKDHKTGQYTETDDCYEDLEATLRSFIPEVQFQDRWSGQVIETIDGLPWIGETTSHQFVATGFSGNGLTFGTISAMMAVDWVAGRDNPWRELFDPNRKKLSAAWTYLKENADYPYYMVKDRLLGGVVETGLAASLVAGDGKVVKRNGQPIAMCRTRAGEIHQCSAVCPHMGCLVHWNASEESWDCPCHGSRFSPDGHVFAGPAQESLASLAPPVGQEQIGR